MQGKSDAGVRQYDRARGSQPVVVRPVTRRSAGDRVDSGEQASRPVSTMEQVIARLDAIDAALMPLAHLALDAEGRVVAVPPISPPTAPPNVPAHEERYAAAREAMYYDTYGAACPRCKAPRWGGCVAVDGDPPDVAPDQAILVRVEYQNGDHVFQHISWPSDQLVAVARGFFEACSALGATS